METEWLISLLIIIGIDLVLGGDNALIIAMASRNLSHDKRNKAIRIGTLLAVIMRITMTGAAVYLLTIPYLQMIGGLFLLYIGYHLLIEQKKESIRVQSSGSLWRAVKTIVIADLFMSLDNVIAVAGAAKGNIVLTAIGLMISVPIIIWGSKLIHAAFTKYPFLLYGGSALLAFTGGEMIVRDITLHPFMTQHTTLEFLLPFLTVTTVILASLFYEQTADHK
ncbi:TerC family protein [Bacillus sp. 179-C3.3 HS]|uniref:TerC family protein n=1 Tax=Bacillus sp. 179-C3.3 HS TaxID=3232162 RepID=UPI0039A1FA1C